MSLFAFFSVVSMSSLCTCSLDYKINFPGGRGGHGEKLVGWPESKSAGFPALVPLLKLHPRQISTRWFLVFCIGAIYWDVGSGCSSRGSLELWEYRRSLILWSQKRRHHKTTWASLKPQICPSVGVLKEGTGCYSRSFYLLSAPASSLRQWTCVEPCSPRSCVQPSRIPSSSSALWSELSFVEILERAPPLTPSLEPHTGVSRTTRRSPEAPTPSSCPPDAPCGSRRRTTCQWRILMSLPRLAWRGWAKC